MCERIWTEVNIQISMHKNMAVKNEMNVKDIKDTDGWQWQQWKQRDNNERICNFQLAPARDAQKPKSTTNNII